MVLPDSGSLRSLTDLEQLLPACRPKQGLTATLPLAWGSGVHSLPVPHSQGSALQVTHNYMQVLRKSCQFYCGWGLERGGRDRSLLWAMDYQLHAVVCLVVLLGGLHLASPYIHGRLILHFTCVTSCEKVLNYLTNCKALCFLILAEEISFYRWVSH